MDTKKVIASGVLPLCLSTGRILLIRRGFDQPNPGTWATFGGKFESGEDIDVKQGAKREFVEESGFKGKFKISSRPIDAHDTNLVKFYTFLGLFDEEFHPDIEAEQESIDYGWFCVGEYPDVLHPGVLEMLNSNEKLMRKIICSYQKK